MTCTFAIDEKCHFFSFIKVQVKILLEVPFGV